MQCRFVFRHQLLFQVQHPSLTEQRHRLERQLQWTTFLDLRAKYQPYRYQLILKSKEPSLFGMQAGIQQIDKITPTPPMSFQTESMMPLDLAAPASSQVRAMLRGRG